MGDTLDGNHEHRWLRRIQRVLDPPRLQLLYGLLPERCGHGLASEAAKRVCDHAFEVLCFSRIEAAMDEPNHRSIAVAERLGLRRLNAPDQTLDATERCG